MVVGVIFIIAFAYAAMYMCGNENQSHDHSVDNNNNLFSNIFQRKNGREYARDSKCDESEIISNSISQQKSDDTIDTNGLNVRVKEMDMELPNYNGTPPMPPSPIQSDMDSVNETNYFSNAFKSSGISPLRTPRVFKKRQQSKFRDKKLGVMRNKQDQNSSVYARDNTPWRSISRHKQEKRHSLADDMDCSDHMSFHTAAKKGRLSSDRPFSKESPTEMAVSSPYGEDGIECVSSESKEQKKCKIDVGNLHKDRSLRRSEITTIESDGSSTIEWGDDISSSIHKGPSFEDNLREIDDIMVEMESYGIEVSARYDSDDID